CGAAAARPPRPGRLTTGYVRGQHDVNRSAAVLAGLDVDAAAERAGALLDLVVAGAPALAGAVVRDYGFDPSVAGLGHAERDPVRRASPQRLVHGLANDLVEADASVLGQAVRSLEVEVELDPVRDPDLVGERLHGRRE